MAINNENKQNESCKVNIHYSDNPGNDSLKPVLNILFESFDRRIKEQELPSK